MTTPNVSTINEGLQIKGNLSTLGSLKVLGGIAGHTKCNDIIVAVMAIIKGNIAAEEVIVFGKVVGNIRADVVSLKAGSHVMGNITSSNFSVEEGAELEGSLSINPKDVTQSASSS